MWHPEGNVSEWVRDEPLRMRERVTHRDALHQKGWCLFSLQDCSSYQKVFLLCFFISDDFKWKAKLICKKSVHNPIQQRSRLKDTLLHCNWVSMDNPCNNKWVITYVSLEICILLSTLYLLIILNVKIEWKEKKMSVEKLNKKKHAIDFFLSAILQFQNQTFQEVVSSDRLSCLGCVFVESPSTNGLWQRRNRHLKLFSSLLLCLF